MLIFFIEKCVPVNYSLKKFAKWCLCKIIVNLMVLSNGRRSCDPSNEGLIFTKPSNSKTQKAEAKAGNYATR
jgi:hypothetical protein